MRDKMKNEGFDLCILLKQPLLWRLCLLEIQSVYFWKHTFLDMMPLTITTLAPSSGIIL